MQNKPSGAQPGFWSSQTLLHHLASIIDPPDPSKVKEACYRLSMGNEVYVTESLSATGRHRKSVQNLKKNQCFVIEPGHFALMITLESIRMPDDALGFLSIQTDVKFKGLVNISGFHVDPGSNGRITFAVFNAGPNPVHLRQGDSIFRLWVADLDTTDRHPNQKPLSPNITMDAVNNISSPLESLQSLTKKVENIDNKLTQLRLIVMTGITFLAIMSGVAFYAYTLGKDISTSSNESASTSLLEQPPKPDARSGLPTNPRARADTAAKLHAVK